MTWRTVLCRHHRHFLHLFIALFSFSLSFAQSGNLASGPGGPILVISSTANPFTHFTAEVLRAEGFNEFASMDINAVTGPSLTGYDVILLGEMTLTPAQVTILEQWTNAGGVLVAFRPDVKLSPLLGLIPTAGSLTDKYLLVNTSTGPGTGIVNKTIQFHGTADYYKSSTASFLALLYADPSNASVYPAVSSNNIGVNGGKAIAFTYDLMRSIVYTRQGNPAWAGQKRDGTSGPIRSDDLFFGGNDPDWIDLNKVDIPQADEQQRLLGNIIIKGNLHRKPLPRFWFLPRGLKAAVVMTGDDHANNGTEGRFDLHVAEGANTAQDLAEWKSTRASSYIWLNTPIAPADAVAYQQQGFEIALHLNTAGGCNNFTPASFDADLTAQLTQFAAQYPGLSAPVTSRTHCLVWSDWASAAKVQAQKGIRLDVNYYYWPDTWVQNRPGMFTGSGMPMRFADLDGSLIDCYQVTTQMTDESGIQFTPFVNQLLDKAIGPEGYYGVFCANMHTDSAVHIGASSIITSAKARGVPVISAKQMLTWLDGRNNSYFSDMVWNNNQLNFSISAASGSLGLRAMLPVHTQTSQLATLTAGGNPVPYTIETIKGISYAFFDASLTGTYTAGYQVDNTAPILSAITAVPGNDNTAKISWTSNETGNSTVLYGVSPASLTSTVAENSLVTSHGIVLPGLSPGVTYYYRVRTNDVAGNSTTAPAANAAPLQFTMPEGPCFSDQLTADFAAGTTGDNTFITPVEGGGVILKPLLKEEFSGNTVPAGWGTALYNPAGTISVLNGYATLSGSHIFSNTSYEPGSAIEFVANFHLADFQNIGFTTDQDFNLSPWVTIGQGPADGKLYLRGSDGTNIELGTGLLGNFHRYLLKWNVSNFECYIDGAAIPAATINLAVTTNMYLQVSDFLSIDGMLSVDWLQVTPFANPGTFISRVMDAGVEKKWQTASWNSSLPQGTALFIAVRTGNTPVPNPNWSAWTTIAVSGAPVNAVSRYIQYKAELSTTDSKYSPMLQDLTIFCVVPSSPVITLQPADLSVCAGSNAILTTAATGASPLTVQWQQNANGNAWTNIASATNPILTINAVTASLNGRRYRAVWKNSLGTVTSNPATLTVKEKPVLSSALAASVNSGDPFQYTPTGTAGTSFTWQRAAVTGIQNPAASGSGAINETLINTSSASVKVTYVYTLTKNGCITTSNLIVTVTPRCTMSGAILANFNGSAIPAGRRIWFSSLFKPSNLGSGPVNFVVTNSRISFKINGQPVTLVVPDARIRFVNNIFVASTDFVNNAWVTQVPLSNPGDAFLTGLAYTVPQNIPGNLKDIKWTADIRADKPGVTVNWKWTADVYSSLGNHANLNVRPVDNLLNLISSSFTSGDAGSILNYIGNIVPGGMNAGLLSFNTNYSASQNLVCQVPLNSGNRSSGEELIVQALPPTNVNPEKTIDARLDALVMPNPGTTQFNLLIKGDNNTPVTVTIADMAGRIIERREKLTANSSLLIGQTWKAGTYIAEIRQGDQRKVVKIVKIN